MGGSSTYGVEQEDGSVIYNIYRDTIFHDSILYEFTKGRTVDIINEDFHHATSVAEYYNEDRYIDEDSVVRGVLRLNGLLEWRMWGDEGFFTFTKYK
jgi:hypothetical protein